MTKRERVLTAIFAAVGGPFLVWVGVSRVEVAGLELPRWIVWTVGALVWFVGAATQLRVVRVAAGFFFLQSATIGFGWRESFFAWWALQTLLFLVFAFLLDRYLFPGRGPAPPAREPALAQRVVSLSETVAIQDRRRGQRR